MIPVKDVLEPRAKPAGPLTTFPGFLGSADLVGTGITSCLDGVAVVTSGKFVNFQEGLIDMAGPEADGRSQSNRARRATPTLSEIPK